MNRSNPRPVIAFKNLPSRMPLVLTLLAWLVLDRFHAPGWVWGATGFFVVLLWTTWIHDLSTTLQIDILRNRDRP